MDRTTSRALLAALKKQKRDLIKLSFDSGLFSPHTITDDDINELCVDLPDYPLIRGNQKERRAARDAQRRVKRTLDEVVQVIGTDVLVDLDRLFVKGLTGRRASKMKSTVNIKTRGAKVY